VRVRITYANVAEMTEDTSTGKYGKDRPRSCVSDSSKTSARLTFIETAATKFRPTRIVLRLPRLRRAR